eukprot:34871_1
MNKEEVKHLDNDSKENEPKPITDNEQESKTNEIIEKYLQIGNTAKQELDELYSKNNTFTLSTNNETTFKLQGKEFKLPTIVKYSSNTKHRSDPMIWYTETICPGDPRMLYETWAYPRYRLQWDSFVSSSNQIIIDNKYPNLFILNTATKPAAGGIISARDFVDLLNIFEVKDNNQIKTVQIASKSIKHDEIPEKKGFVRGIVVLSGVLFDRLDDNDMEKYKLPKLIAKDNDDEKESTSEIEWTKLRYIVQSNIKGWIPQSVINTAMSSTNVGMMRDIRNFVINQRLKLK